MTLVTQRRELWKAHNDGLVYKVGRTARPIGETPETGFTMDITEPLYYAEGGLPSDSGPYQVAANASSSAPGIAGIKPGVTRTNYASSINWNTPQTLSNLNLTGTAAANLRSMTGTGHTLNNVLCVGLDSATSSPVTGGIIDCRASSCSNLTFNHVTIRPTFPNDRWDGIYGHDFLAFRCLIERVVDGIAAVNQYSSNVNVEIAGCWIGNHAWFNDDRGAHTDGTHNDGIQHHTGLNCHVHGTTFWGYKWNALNPTNSGGGTTPLGYVVDETSNRNPQIGQLVLDQTEAYFHVGNAEYDHLWVYGGDNALKPSSKCGVAGHNHRYASNQQLHDIVFQNDDQRDHGGTYHFYPIRTDSSAIFNDIVSPYPGQNASYPGVPAWNIKYANNSNADRKYNVDPTRRNTDVFIRSDAV